MLKSLLIAFTAFTAFTAFAASTSAVDAATITYVLSLNDNGTGTQTNGSYAVYAFTSAGDNAGLHSFTITTSRQTTTTNVSPQATFVPNAPGPDNRTSGFTLLRTTGSSNLANTGQFDTATGNGVVMYGVGQSVGNVRNAVPAGFTASSTVAEGAFGVTNSFTTGTILTANNNVGGATISYGAQVPVLLSVGTFSALTPTISLGAGNVFTGSGSSAAVASIIQATRTLTPEPASLAGLAVAAIGLTTRGGRAVK